jgi:hypothetical protein
MNNNHDKIEIYSNVDVCANVIHQYYFGAYNQLVLLYNLHLPTSIAEAIGVELWAESAMPEPEEDPLIVEVEASTFRAEDGSLRTREVESPREEAGPEGVESIEAATAYSTFSEGAASASGIDCPAKVALEFASIDRNRYHFYITHTCR